MFYMQNHEHMCVCVSAIYVVSFSLCYCVRIKTLGIIQPLIQFVLYLHTKGGVGI